MGKFFLNLSLSFLVFQEAHAITSKIAEIQKNPPTFGFSHPLLSSHFRNTLGLRNLVSKTTLLEVIQTTGPDLGSCSIRVLSNSGRISRFSNLVSSVTGFLFTEPSLLSMFRQKPLLSRALFQGKGANLLKLKACYRKQKSVDR